MKMDVEQFDILGYLSVLPLFNDLSTQERVRLVQGCQLKRLSRGDMVFRVGEECSAFFIVVVGKVKLYVASSSGQEKIVELIGPGHTFAEAMMFLNMLFPLNARALVDTLILSVSKKTVFDEIERAPHFSMNMLVGISRQLHGLVRDVEGYALHSGIQRLIGYLLRDVQERTAVNMGAVTVCLQVSKAAIASRLSLTPEYFSRILHELEAEGLIEIDKREIRILDVQRLACYGSI